MPIPPRQALGGIGTLPSVSAATSTRAAASASAAQIAQAWPRVMLAVRANVFKRGSSRSSCLRRARRHGWRQPIVT
ncbi:hypothetical protein XF14_11180 [Burkholderia gladioli]|nr:hypothetical protein XF14_11180 [Burkholderia gladioli]